MPEMSMKEFYDKVSRWMKEFPKEAERVMGGAALSVYNEVVEKHLSGPRMDEGIGSKTRATLARRTGDLVSSIAFRVKRAGSRVSGEVGNWKNPLFYAPLHEYGRGKMPERSFLRSSLNAKRKSIREIFLNAIKRSYTNA